MWNSPDRRTSSECHGATTNGDGTKGIAINRRSVVQVHVSSSTFDALLEEEVSLWTTVCDQFFAGVLFWKGFLCFAGKHFPVWDEWKLIYEITSSATLKYIITIPLSIYHLNT